MLMTTFFWAGMVAIGMVLTASLAFAVGRWRGAGIGRLRRRVTRGRSGIDGRSDQRRQRGVQAAGGSDVVLASRECVRARDQRTDVEAHRRAASEMLDQQRRNGHGLAQRGGDRGSALERAVEETVQQVLDRPGEFGQVAGSGLLGWSGLA